MTKNKNGFTLLELIFLSFIIAVVFIAVIPTMVILTKKALKPNEEILVTCLNECLEEGDSMQDAVKNINERGYDIGKFDSLKNKYYAFDESLSKFVLLNKKFDTIFPEKQNNKQEKVWIVVLNDNVLNSVEDKQFNLYIGNDVKSKTIKSKGSVDIGSNYDIKIEYTDNNQENVYIKANGGSVTVDNKNAVVDQYGNTETVTILNALTFNNRAQITNLSINNVQTNVNMTREGNARNIVYDVFKYEEIPSNVDFNISIGQIVKPNIMTTNADFLPYIKTNKNLLNCKISNEILSGVGALTTVFAGGKGTQEDPYLISTDEQFQKIENYSGRYFKMIDSVTITIEEIDDTNDYYFGWLNLKLDGDNNTLSVNCPTNKKNTFIFTKLNNSVIKNLIVKNTSNHALTLVDEAVQLTVDNVSYYSTGIQQTYSNYSIFVANVTNTLKLNRCINHADINSNDRIAIYVGTAKENARVEITNCVSIGKISTKDFALCVANGENNVKYTYEGNHIIGKVIVFGNSYFGVYGDSTNDGGLDDDSKNMVVVKVEQLGVILNEDGTVTIKESSFSDLVVKYVVSVQAKMYYRDGETFKLLENYEPAYITIIDQEFEATQFEEGLLKTEIKTYDGITNIGTLESDNMTTISGDKQYYYFPYFEDGDLFLTLSNTNLSNVVVSNTIITVETYDIDNNIISSYSYGK